MADARVALWSVRYGTPDVEMFDSEEAAAQAAVLMVDYNTASPLGVQLADGRVIRRNEWHAYRAAEERQHALDREHAKAATEQPQPMPVRHVSDPFGGQYVLDVYDQDELPEWVR